MSYLRKHLMPNEKIIAESQLHWIIFFMPVFYSILLIIYTIYRPLQFPLIIDQVGMAFVAIAWFLAVLRYLTTEFAVSKTRILMKYGFIQIRASDMLTSRIESVQLQQSMLGNILGYGAVIVSGTGGDKMLFSQLTDPNNFRQAILAISEKNAS